MSNESPPRTLQGLFDVFWQSLTLSATSTLHLIVNRLYCNSFIFNSLDN